jgi:Fructose-1,6-bisphosphate aldolase
LGGWRSLKTTEKHIEGMLFTTEGFGNFISGAILFEETLFQNHPDGEPMVKKLEKLGIIPGIKVDKRSKTISWWP